MGIDIWPFQGSSFITKDRGQLKNKSNNGNKLGRPGKGKGQGGGGSDPVTGSSDSIAPYVIIYLPFDGSDTSTTITDVAGNSWTAQNQAQLSTTDPKVGTASLKTDGTDDRVYINTDPQRTRHLLVGTKKFSISCWVKPTNLSNYQDIFLHRHDTPGTAVTLVRIQQTTGKIRLYQNPGTGVTADIESTGAVTAGSWNHVAVEYTGTGNPTIYVNGTGGQTVTTWTGWDDPPLGTGYRFSIAGHPGTAYDLNGYVDEFVFVNGTNRWSGDFTPPTTAFDYTIPVNNRYHPDIIAFWNMDTWYTSLILEESTNQYDLNELYLNSTTGKTGSAAAGSYFDTTTGNITTNGILPNDSGSVSFWLLHNSSNAVREHIMMKGDATNTDVSTNDFRIVMEATDGEISLITQAGGGGTPTTTTMNTGVSVVKDSAWHHYVITWDTTAGINVHRDNVRLATGIPFTASDSTSTDFYLLACDAALGENFLGYMDELYVFNRPLTVNEVDSLYTYYNSPF